MLLLVGAVEQGDRRDRRGAPRAAAGRPGGRLGPAVRAAQHASPRTARRAPASSPSCATSPTSARAEREIEENYRKLRVAEAEARAERDRLEPDHRLGRRPHRRHRSGGETSSDERARGAALHRAARRAARRAAARQANDAHFSSFVRRTLPARTASSASGRDRLVDPRPARAAGRRRRRQDPVRARRADRGRHDPARSTEAIEKARSTSS